MVTGVVRASASRCCCSASERASVAAQRSDGAQAAVGGCLGHQHALCGPGTELRIEAPATECMGVLFGLDAQPIADTSRDAVAGPPITTDLPHVSHDVVEPEPVWLELANRQYG